MKKAGGCCAGPGGYCAGPGGYSAHEVKEFTAQSTQYRLRRGFFTLSMCFGGKHARNNPKVSHILEALGGGWTCETCAPVRARACFFLFGGLEFHAARSCLSKSFQRPFFSWSLWNRLGSDWVRLGSDWEVEGTPGGRKHPSRTHPHLTESEVFC